MMRFIIYRSIKISLGTVVAIAIAQVLKLDYTISAGVIALLSMLDLKRHTIKIGLKRIYTAFIAFAISSLLFTLFGFSLPVFFCFLLFYIILVLKLNAMVGLVINTVLVTHLYALQEITVNSIANEFALMLIGITIALIFNLHMPNKETDMKKLQLSLEEQLRHILYHMGTNLNNLCELDVPNISLIDLKKTLEDGKRKAYEFMNSYYLKDNSYFVEYFEMRERQYNDLVYMQKHLNTVFITQKEATLLSEFTLKLSKEFQECNLVETLLADLEQLKADFKVSELPKTRDEFENRASLYQYLNDLEAFITIKSEFIKNYGGIKYCSK